MHHFLIDSSKLLTSNVKGRLCYCQHTHKTHAKTVKTMERFNSWSAIKQTFSRYSQSNSMKIQSNRRKNNVKRKTASHSIQRTISTRSKEVDSSIIEDSDEENLNGNEIDVSAPQTKSKKPKLVPLNASIMCTPRKPSVEIGASVSDDVITASGNECGQTVNANSAHNRSVVCQKTDGPPTNTKQKMANAMNEDLMNIRNALNGSRVTKEQAVLEDSIIDTDTDDEDEADRQRIHATMTAVPLDVHLSSSRSNLERLNSEPIIDSVSSFGSIQYKSQTQNAPAHKSQKRLKVTKGGLTDALQRSIRKSKSDHAFWLNERQSILAPPGERVLIEKIDQSYGCILVQCVPVDDNGDDVKIFCLNPESKKLPFLAIGKTIEVEFNTNGYRLDARTMCYPNVNNIMVP